MTAAFCVLVGTASGIGLSPDSANYIAAARSLVDGKGLSMLDGGPFVLWPPLYPAILATVGLLGWDPLVNSRFVNATLFGMLVWMTAGWLIRRLDSKPLTVFAIAAVIFSRPVMEAALFAWSETLFILLAMISLFMLDRYRRFASGHALLWSALAAGGACLTRYSGVVLLVVAPLALLTWAPMSLRRRLLAAAAFSGAAASPLVVWTIRNLSLSSSVAGERVPSDSSLLLNLYRMLRVLASWVVTIDYPPRSVVAVSAVVLVVLLCAGARYMWTNRSRADPQDCAWIPRAGVFALFTAAYSILLLVITTITSLDPLDDRLMAPVYVPLLLVIILLLCSLWRVVRGRRVVAGLGMVMLGWTALLAYQRLSDLAASSHGIGYSGVQWRESQLSDYLRAHAPPGNVYTNDPYGYYFVSGAGAQLLNDSNVMPLERDLRKACDTSVKLRPVIVWFATSVATAGPNRANILERYPFFIIASGGSISQIYTCPE